MTSINDKEAAKLLAKKWESFASELQRVKAEIALLKARESYLLISLDTFLETFKLLGVKPESIVIPPELMFKQDASIGDSIEQLLRERGDLKKIEVSRELQKAGKITTKNARVILANAIKKDARKRFTIKDGRIYLNEKQ